METGHQPVLLNEVVTHLIRDPDGVYIDATFGRGGHAKAILQQLSAKGHLLAIDKDPSAIAFGKQLMVDERFSIEQGSFANMPNFIKRKGWLGKVSGILMDLGVSSPQLDEAERGFSFKKEGPLDMRMDSSQALDAATWLAQVSEEDLAMTLREYGEERYAKRIARAIIVARQSCKLTTTTQLADIIKDAHPDWNHKTHPATKSFQAIRIVINQELDELKQLLDQVRNILSVGGRLAVICFHSLETRIVKQFLNTQAEETELPLDFPIKGSPERYIKRVAVVKPNKIELNDNVRARSAVLRVMEKIK